MIRQSHNGTAVTCARDQTPTVHTNVSISLIRDVGPPRLRSRVEDTIGPPALRCACGMLPDSESHCRVADGVVESKWIGPAVTGLYSEAGYAVQRNTPPGGLVEVVLHGREANWSSPLLRRHVRPESLDPMLGCIQEVQVV
jgi:hypothetical protein